MLRRIKTGTMKFSECINELTVVWLGWMEHDVRAKDENLSYSERRESAKRCEELIDTEYRIIERINAFFDKKECSEHGSERSKKS